MLGFSTVFVALGASASAIGAVLRAYSGELAIVAGIVIIVMGLHFLGLTPIALLMREKRLEVPKPAGLSGAYLMGLAFAFGWTPCIGPILAAILAVAASEETVAKGAGMLAVYSLGLGIPFIVAALAVEPFAAFLARFRAHLGLVEKAMGGLLVLTGIAFLTGAVTHASFWLLIRFRCWGRSGRMQAYVRARLTGYGDEAIPRVSRKLIASALLTCVQLRPGLRRRMISS